MLTNVKILWLIENIKIKLNNCVKIETDMNLSIFIFELVFSMQIVN